MFYKQEQQTYGTASTTSYRFYGFSKSRSLFVLYAVMQTETEGPLCQNSGQLPAQLQVVENNISLWLSGFPALCLEDPKLYLCLFVFCNGMLLVNFLRWMSLPFSLPFDNKGTESPLNLLEIEFTPVKASVTSIVHLASWMSSSQDKAVLGAWKKVLNFLICPLINNHITVLCLSYAMCVLDCLCIYKNYRVSMTAPCPLHFMLSFGLLNLTRCLCL